jgi:hypothetical protein
LFAAFLLGLLVAAAAVGSDATTATPMVYSLSVARGWLAVISVSNLALFGGGQDSSGGCSIVVDIFNVTSGFWNTALFMLCVF